MYVYMYVVCMYVCICIMYYVLCVGRAISDAEVLYNCAAWNRFRIERVEPYVAQAIDAVMFRPFSMHLNDIQTFLKCVSYASIRQRFRM